VRTGGATWIGPPLFSSWMPVLGGKWAFLRNEEKLIKTPLVPPWNKAEAFPEKLLWGRAGQG